MPTSGSLYSSHSKIQEEPNPVIMEEANRSLGGSSGRNRSFGSIQMDCDSALEAGDIGDRAISLRLSPDRAAENSGAVFPVTLFSDDPSPVSQPLSDKKKIPKVLEYSSCLTHLAVFGILGVLTRYSLQKLFGPGIAGVTSNEGILYQDLPSNMVGSFLMGWFGVVFKPDIVRVSDSIAIGLTTGYLGSLTTFSGWNQKMLELSSQGQWVSAIVGFLIGLFLAAYSIIFGVETARGFRFLLEKKLAKQKCKTGGFSNMWTVNTFERHVGVMVVLVLMLALLWGLSGVLLRDEFSNDGDKAQLWLACLVGPLGVWIRWFLARLNGCGLGSTDRLRWIPFGTLIANVLGSCIMAALATVNKAVNNKTCDTVTHGIQLGFSGCLSTVSTFVAEFNAMRESKHPWQAYAYATITICLSLGFGVVIYSVPVWTQGFE